MPFPAPARRRGFEYLDDPAVPAAVRERSLRDVVRSNTLFGGARALLRELARVLPAGGADATLLDVGTGLGDLPRRARRLAERRGVRLTTFGCDASESLIGAARPSLIHCACGDALALSFATHSVDIVTCSQLLHHFEHHDGVRLIRELHRVARRAVIVSDLRRSWVAAGGFWLASFPLGFHPITRHDGVASVLRGFTAAELAALVCDATGRAPAVRRHPGYRLTARWSVPGSAP
ncbi:MAG TPA: methyltransferase domain-containing protein [Gemmatimonadaceae bacterium]|nr:methyltransferase domain-containing protein [Gemmatimonadaceae bacterium]